MVYTMISNTQKEKPRFRTHLNLKCHSCGHRTKVRTERMVCELCGEGSFWICWKCHHKIDPETDRELTLCTKCRYFVCPDCGSCGCQLQEKMHPILHYKEVKSLHDMLM